MPDSFTDFFEKYAVAFKPISRYINRKKGDITQLDSSPTWRRFLTRSIVITRLFVPKMNRFLKRRGVDPVDDNDFLLKTGRNTVQTVQDLAAYRSRHMVLARAEIGRSTFTGRQKLQLLRGLRKFDDHAAFSIKQRMSMTVSQINNEQMMEKRDYYVWRSRRDDKVRDEHRALDGKRFE